MKLALATILALCVACGGGSMPGNSPTVKTPKGVTVKGAAQADVYPIIDAQLDDLFAIAEKQGYSGFSRHPAYTVEFLARDPRCTEAAFVVTAQTSSYDGSEYDMDPRPGYVGLCAAGRFLPETGVIQVTATGVRTSEIVRYEGEHKLLHQVDRPRYTATMVHASGQGHPILGD